MTAAGMTTVRAAGAQAGAVRSTARCCHQHMYIYIHVYIRFRRYKRPARNSRAKSSRHTRAYMGYLASHYHTRHPKGCTVYFCHPNYHVDMEGMYHGYSTPNPIQHPSIIQRVKTGPSQRGAKSIRKMVRYLHVAPPTKVGEKQVARHGARTIGERQ